MFLDKLKKLKSYKTETTPCKVKLSSNENPFDLPEELKEKIAEEIKKIPFQRYPDPNVSELREILANLYNVKESNLVFGNGSDELIQLLIMTIGNIKNPVAYPIPTFPMYQVSSDTIGREKVEFQLDENFDLQKNEIDKALEKSPDLVFYASPNNPTGNSFNRELIKYTADNNVFVVVDEAYIDFSDKESFLDEALNRDNLVILRTMSKIGLASIRLGVLIAKEEVATEINKGRLPFNITYPTQIIAKVVLTEGLPVIKEQIEILKKEREKLINELKNFDGIKVYPSDANFILIKTPNGDLVHKKLIEKGVLVRNMSHIPKMENCLRVSIGKPEENEIFLEALKKVLEENF
ncbi:MAG: histidinol-phosphate transaminase [Persephonella sp.]|nr:MAG: histidinol-phosphate transaminase [Persephonella sp.]